MDGGPLESKHLMKGYPPPKKYEIKSVKSNPSKAICSQIEETKLLTIQENAPSILDVNKNAARTFLKNF